MEELNNQMLDTENQQVSPVNDDDDYAYLNEDTNYAELDNLPQEMSEDAEEVGGSDEQAEGQEEVAPVTKPVKPHNKRPGYYARINQEQRRRDEEMEHLRQQNLLLMQQMQRAQIPEGPVDEATRQAQQVEQFVKQVAQEVVKGEIAPLKQQEQERLLQQEQRKFQASLNKAAQRFGDFHDVVTYNPEIARDANIMGAAQLLPNAPEVLYHLGRNEDLLFEIKDLPPIKQAARLVQIGQEIATRTQQKKFTKAPAPLSKGHQGLNKTVGSNKSLGAMTKNDFMAEAKDW